MSKPKRWGPSISFRLPLQLHPYLERNAAETERSVGQVVQTIMIETLERAAVKRPIEIKEQP